MHLYMYTEFSDCTHQRNMGIQGLRQLPGLFFVFFVFCFVSQGQDRCETLASAPRGAEGQVRPPTRVEVCIL